MTFFWTAKNSK